ncbi:hypothetical protein AB0L70_35655 [Kribbella sp. NPDC051952]|uniref:hypothetical protein n=1 Tax=Kribbella sp. NPDC051952 TaxID=3154851 RepID=UPI003432E022
MAWLSVLGTLLGAVIGSLTTIVSQRYSQREAERKDRIAQLEAERKDRVARVAERRDGCHEAIVAFLEVYQEIESAANNDGPRSEELTRRLWILHNRLALIASGRLSESLGGLADALNSTYWNGAPDGLRAYEHLYEPLKRFRIAARAELLAYDDDRAFTIGDQLPA